MRPCEPLVKLIVTNGQTDGTQKPNDSRRTSDTGGEVGDATLQCPLASTRAVVSRLKTGLDLVYSGYGTEVGCFLVASVSVVEVDGTGHSLSKTELSTKL